MKNRLASLSLDLDNKWSYLKTHGDLGWESFPSYFDVVVPRFLDYFERHGVRVTVFVVGQDAVLAKNQTTLRLIADFGHEIGNHSFQHEPWLHRYTQQELLREIIRAEDAIVTATGQRPIGFRGPGYSRGESLFQILDDCGYCYDASTLPTYLGPAARLFYFLKSSFSRQQLTERKQLFGRFRDGLLSLRPYRIAGTRGPLLEIPVTTIPIVRLPFHLSYVHYLAQFSERLALSYFAAALRICRLFQVEPSILLHPLDFMGPEDVPELQFFPGMQRPRREKLRLMERVMNILQRNYRVVTMGQHAAAELGAKRNKTCSTRNQPRAEQAVELVGRTT